jgi:hypothetical protein
MLEFVKRLFRRSPDDADRRRGLRVEAPRDTATVFVDGVPHPLKNWSAHGFLAGPYTGPRAVGEKCVISLSIRQDPFAIAFATEVVIVRKDGSDIAGRFVFLPPEYKAQVDAYFTFHSRMA